MSTIELSEIKPDSANVYNASGLALVGQKKYDKVPGVELEKSSVDQVTAPLPLGIKK